MRVFRTLGEALDMPGLEAVGSLLAARTAQMLTAAMRYLEDELDAGETQPYLRQSSHQD